MKMKLKNRETILYKRHKTHQTEVVNVVVVVVSCKLCTTNDFLPRVSLLAPVSKLTISVPCFYKIGFNFLLSD